MPVRDLLSAASSQGAAPADPYFYDVSLLLNGDGTNGAQNNTFLDSSSNAFTITRNGNTTQGSFSPYGNLWSNYLASGSRLRGGSSISTGTGDFTVECWTNMPSPASNTNGNIFITIGDEQTGTGCCFYQYNNSVRIYGATGVGSPRMNISYTFSPNVWYHIAFVRSSGTITAYVNGTSIGTATASGSGNAFSGNPIVNEILDSGNYYNGDTDYISNLRVTNTAVYTSNFTPSTTPLTAISGTQFLTCQSNRFIDNSSNAVALTSYGSPSVQRFSPFNPTAPYSTSVIGGSGYFDANGAYLQASANTAFELGSGDYTLECWLYLTANGNSNGSGLISKGAFNSLGTEVYTLQVNNSNIIQFYVFASSGSYTSPVVSSSSSLALNTWYHIAVTRSGSTHTMWINGVSSNTASSSYTISTGGTMNIGGTWYDPGASAREITGYMCDSRVVKGTAVYTTTFTPPTSPETAISGTSLLLNYTNAGIPDLAMQNDLQTVGSAQVSTSVKKYGTGSLAFDGSTGYLITPLVPSDGFGTGSFTIECWLYLNSLKNYNTVFDMRNGNGVYPCITISSGGNIYWFINSTIVIDSGASAISTGSWTHIAVCRSGTSTKLFVNGTQAGSTYSDSNNYLNSNVHVGAGESSNPPAGNYLDGYIDDLRITNGYARYTSNFTPPTAALPTY